MLKTRELASAAFLMAVVYLILTRPRRPIVIVIEPPAPALRLVDAVGRPVTPRCTCGAGEGPEPIGPHDPDCPRA